VEFLRELMMAVLQWTLVLLLTAFLVHLLIWRLRKPKSPLKALLLILLAVIGLGLAALYFADGIIGRIGLLRISGPAAYLHVALASISMALGYMVSYTLIEWDSPTLTIVTMIAQAGKNGLAEAELGTLADRLSFIHSRIQTLVRDNVMVEKDGRFIISPGRHMFYRFVLFYHRVIRTDTQSG
jgi:hypothetical protein